MVDLMPLHLPKSTDIPCIACLYAGKKYTMPVIMPANLNFADCSPSLLAAAAVVPLVVLQLGRTRRRLRHIPGPFFAKFTNFQRV